MNCSDDLCVQQNNILLKHMSFMVPRPRQDRAWSGPSMPRLSPNAAVQALLDVGILKKPNLCPKCNQGTLQGPWPRHDAKESEKILGLRFLIILHQRFVRIRWLCSTFSYSVPTLSPPKFYQLLLVYFTPGVVRLQQCVRVQVLTEI